MRKPYFAKKIKVAPKIGIAPGVPGSGFEEEHLFLCMSHLKKGDRVKCIKTLLGKGDVGFSGLTYETSYLTEGKEYEIWMDDGSYWGVYSDDGPMNFPKSYFQNFKILGPISPQAAWVKEGDEFDEDEWRKTDFINRPSIWQIKGPCGHFH